LNSRSPRGFAPAGAFSFCELGRDAIAVARTVRLRYDASKRGGQRPWRRACTIPSYLVARPSRDLIRAAHQHLTREWWETRRVEYDTYVSQLVVDEAAGGDVEAAAERLGMLSGVPRLEVSEEAVGLARQLLDRRALPPNAADDALHVAVASVHGMDILLTWNCTHIANPDMMGAVRAVIDSCGYEWPVICTPAEMLGGTE